MAVDKYLSASSVGHIGVWVVVVHDACDEELQKVVHVLIFVCSAVQADGPADPS
jgi:hypothetical protein